MHGLWIAWREPNNSVVAPLTCRLPFSPWQSQPRMSTERVERLRRWHDDSSAELRALGGHDVEHLGVHLHVPAGVFPPAPMSQPLGRAVIAEVRDGDRVLDMGTGSGVNAILAARSGAQVVTVDVNPVAVTAATFNAESCGVADRVDVREADLFDWVDDTFDVVVFDPPFRWFAPTDMLERAITDDGYTTLARFFDEVRQHLAPGGRLLMLFGTTGDTDHFHELAAQHQFAVEAFDSSVPTKGDSVETYWAFRLRHDRT